jgi:formate-nitrite transporter family protein
MPQPMKSTDVVERHESPDEREGPEPVEKPGSGEESNRPKSIEKPEAGTRLSAAEIHDNVVGPAGEEMDRAASALLFSSFGSGLTIGFSFLLGAFMQTFVSEKYAPLVAGAAYPLGFAFVIFARSELFTENTLEPVVPFLHKRDAETFRKLMRMWGLLLFGNLVGAALFAWVMYHSNIIDAPDFRARLAAMATESTSDGFVQTLTRGIMAGWLIALLAWLLASTQDSMAQLVLIWLTTAPISWFHFRHSIVGSVEAFYRVVSGSAGLGEMAGQFIVPAILGNTIGGVVLVALLNYGQVQPERGPGGEK